jgi:hypothetical protein
MNRFNVYLAQEQLDFLHEYGKLTISEHIRRAIDKYIKELIMERISASKGGDRRG